MSIFGGSCLQLSHLSPSQGQSLSVRGDVEGPGFWLCTLQLSHIGMGQG